MKNVELWKKWNWWIFVSGPYFYVCDVSLWTLGLDHGNPQFLFEKGVSCSRIWRCKSGDSVFRKIRFWCMRHQCHIIRLAKLSWTFFTHFGDLSLNPKSRMYVFLKFCKFSPCDHGFGCFQFKKQQMGYNNILYNFYMKMFCFCDIQYKNILVYGKNNLNIKICRYIKI